MLYYFRINDPYRLLGLLVLLMLLGLPLFIDTPAITGVELHSMALGMKVSDGFSMYDEIIDRTPPLTAWLYGFSDWLFGKSLTGRHIFTFLILFFQSAFIGIMFIDKRTFTENTFIPSLIFSMLTFLSFDVFSLTGDLAAFGFLLLALNKLLTEIEFREQRDENIFNLGLFLSIATLFTFSYLVFLPGFFILLIIYTRNSARKYMLMLVGFLLPHVLMVCIYYLKGHTGLLWDHFYKPNLAFDTTPLVGARSLLAICAVPLVYLFISIFVLNREARLTKYQAQVLQIMLLVYVFAFIQLYFSGGLRPQSMLVLAPSVSFILTHFLLLIRRRKFATLHVWILLVGITSTLYLTRYQKIPQVDFSSLWVSPPATKISGKKVWMIDNEPGSWLKNTPSPPMLDKKLVQAIVNAPDYFENLILVNRLFELDPPEVIIDPKMKLKNFFDRLPAIAKQYKREGENWVRISN